MMRRGRARGLTAPGLFEGNPSRTALREQVRARPVCTFKVERVLPNASVFQIAKNLRRVQPVGRNVNVTAAGRTILNSHPFKRQLSELPKGVQFIAREEFIRPLNLKIPAIMRGLRNQ